MRWDLRKRAKALAPMCTLFVGALWTPVIRDDFSCGTESTRATAALTSSTADMCADEELVAYCAGGQWHGFSLLLFLGLALSPDLLLHHFAVSVDLAFL